MKIDLESDKWKLLTEFAIGGGIKVFFLLFFFIEFCLYKNIGHFSRSTFSWTNSFFIKMSFNFFLSINYAAFGLTIGGWFYLLHFNSLIWLISCGLLYFEYIRQMQQSWLSLRLFWFINGLYYIGKISYTSLCYFNSNKADLIALNLLYCYIIQSIPSLFLMAFSVFKPSDNILLANNMKDSVKVKDDNKDNSIPNKSFISNYTHKLTIKKRKTLVNVLITERKSAKYEMKDNILIPMNVNWNKLEDIRLKIKVIFYPNVTYSIKKTLYEIIEFNWLLIQKAESNKKQIKRKCTSVIQLKNLTNLFMKKFNCSSKLNELQSIYSDLCQKHSFALIEFIQFCEVEDDKLKHNLINLYNQIQRRDDIEDEDNNKEIIIDDIINSKHKDDFFADLIDNNNNYNKGMESNDVNKTASYIFSMLNKEHTQSLKIISVIDKPKLNDSEIICEINTEITISITWKNLITLINHDERINQTKTISKLKEFVKDGKNLNNIKKEGNPIRVLIESIFNEMINNLMYLDELLFIMFDLNKIIKLDNEEIDIDIVNLYFELDLFLSMNESNKSFYHSNPKCLIESIKYYASCEECNNDIALKIKVDLSTDTDKKWDTIICLNEMNNQCNEIILLNEAFNRFASLTALLKSITQTMRKIVEGYDEIDGSGAGDCDANDINNKIEKEIVLLSNKEHSDKDWFNNVSELNELLNQCLTNKHYYIFYTPYFRKAFRIDQFMNDTGNSDNNYAYNKLDDNLDDSFSNHNSFYDNLKC